MTPSDFIKECDRRGIVLSLLPPLSTGELPRISYRVQGKLLPNVLETIKQHKAAIVSVLASKSPNADEVPSELLALGQDADAEINAINPLLYAEGPRVTILDDGRRLYQHGEADWRYVPPGEDPAEFRSNFPSGYTLTCVRKRRF